MAEADRPLLAQASVNSYRAALEARALSPSTVNPPFRPGTETLVPGTPGLRECQSVNRRRTTVSQILSGMRTTTYLRPDGAWTACTAQRGDCTDRTATVLRVTSYRVTRCLL